MFYLKKNHFYFILRTRILWHFILLMYLISKGQDTCNKSYYYYTTQSPKTVQIAFNLSGTQKNISGPYLLLGKPRRLAVWRWCSNSKSSSVRLSRGMWYMR